VFGDADIWRRLLVRALSSSVTSFLQASGTPPLGVPWNPSETLEALAPPCHDHPWMYDSTHGTQRSPYAGILYHAVAAVAAAAREPSSGGGEDQGVDAQLARQDNMVSSTSPLAGNNGGGGGVCVRSYAVHLGHLLSSYVFAHARRPSRLHRKHRN
jgi:hypothetical protein